MKPEPGTYVLILCSDSQAEVRVGRWGRLAVEPGYYLYVGSAFGPGGVRARVLRHCRKAKSRHWHVDYLRECLIPVGAWCSYAGRDLEHRWARSLAGMAGMTAIKGFGCSDCNCRAHLFATATAPELARFVDLVGGEVEPWVYPATRAQRPG